MAACAICGRTITQVPFEVDEDGNILDPNSGVWIDNWRRSQCPSDLTEHRP